MLDENPHFKNIFFSKIINNRLICVGMDRIISFWNINENKINYDFNIKCLGSKSSSFALSNIDPSSALFLCNDKTMRLWNISKKTNRFISTILWKGLDKKKLLFSAFHEAEESIIALVSDNTISLMDIHAHTVISEFTIPKI